MHVEDDVGTGEHEVLIAAFQLHTAEVFCGEIPSLKRSAGRPIEHEDALGE